MSFSAINLTTNKQAAHEKEEAVLDQVFEALKGKTEPIRIEMEAKQKALIPLRKVVNESQQKLSVTEAEITFFNEKTTKAKAAFKDAKESLAGFDGKKLAKLLMLTCQSRLLNLLFFFF